MKKATSHPNENGAECRFPSINLLSLYGVLSQMTALPYKHCHSFVCCLHSCILLFILVLLFLYIHPVFVCIPFKSLSLA